MGGLHDQLGQANVNACSLALRLTSLASRLEFLRVKRARSMHEKI